MLDMLKQYLPPNFVKLEKNKDVEGLYKVLSVHKDRATREKAAYALGRITSEPQRDDAIDCLEKYLKDPDEDEGIRSTCAVALGHHNTVARVEKLLISLADDESEGIRSAIVQALSDFKTPESTMAILKCLNDNSPKVKAFAADCLGLSISIISPLKDSLFNENDAVRAKAVKDLGASDSRKALDVLMMIIESPNADEILRRRAILAMGGFGIPAIVEPLMAIAHREFGENLVAIYTAIGKVKNEQNIDFLIEGLTKDSPAIKAACIQALCEKRSDKAVEKLISILLNPNEFQEQRISVAKALAKNKGGNVLDAMISILGSSEEQLRSRIEDSIVEMDHPDLPSKINHLISSPNEVERFSAAKIIIKQKKAGMGTLLLKLTEDPHEEVRNLAVIGLGDFREHGISDKLISILSNSQLSSTIRGNAARSLGRLTEDRAVPPLFDALKDENEYVRGCSAVALSYYKKAEVVDVLGNALQTEYSEKVKCMIIESMGQIKDAKVLDYLKKAAQDPVSAAVRNTASRMLGSVGSMGK